MSCKSCSENSSTTYSRCNPPVSSNCLFYQGVAKQCSNDSTFNICKGDNFSDVQSLIFDKICKLIGDTNVSTIQIPTCLKQAWDDSDLSIFNLFTLLLEQHCVLQTEVTNLTNSISTVNPEVEICLGCCEETGCNNSATILLSDALQKIVSCICTLKSQVTSLSTEVGNLTTQYNALVTQVGVIQTNVTNIVNAQPEILKRLSCVEFRIDSTPEVYPNCQ